MKMGTQEVNSQIPGNQIIEGYKGGLSLPQIEDETASLLKWLHMAQMAT